MTTPPVTPLHIPPEGMFYNRDYDAEPMTSHESATVIYNEKRGYPTMLVGSMCKLPSGDVGIMMDEGVRIGPAFLAEPGSGGILHLTPAMITAIKAHA